MQGTRYEYTILHYIDTLKPVSPSSFLLTQVVYSNQTVKQYSTFKRLLTLIKLLTSWVCIVLFAFKS